jgi:transposase
MTKRTKVELFEQIRKAHAGIESPSIRDLSRVYGVHRRTVRQALANAVPPERKTTQRKSPSLDPWKVTIQGWIEADRTAPKKQRHTARRVFQRLTSELGAEVSESTMRHYVAVLKANNHVSVEKVCVPQSHPLGDEAEVDFGQFFFQLNGVLVEAWMFVMRLSASGKAFHFASFNQAQEVFIEGHVRAFEYFGGVPRRVRYDNLKTAVVRPLKGRSRVETERFVALRSHYLFDSFFCLPGVNGAHEKGGVEGEIGRFRRRHLVPVPDLASLLELNVLIEAGDVLDDDRHVDGRRLSVGEHFALETAHLSALPAEHFASELVLSCRVDTKSRVCVRQNFYSVPVTYAGQRVTVRLGANTVSAHDGTRVLAAHDRSPGKGREVLELDHYLETLAIKAGALAGSSALHLARASGRFTSTHDEFLARARRTLGDGAGTRAMIGVLLLERTMKPSAVREGMARRSRVGTLDPALVAIEARRSLEEVAPVLVVDPALTHYDREAPSVSHYDELLSVR